MDRREDPGLLRISYERPSCAVHPTACCSLCCVQPPSSRAECASVLCLVICLRLDRVPLDSSFLSFSSRLTVGNLSSLVPRLAA